jgi:hypothetical protein
VTNLPVPVPRTFTVSETETAAYLNSIRDALNFLLNPPMFSGYGATAQTVGAGGWVTVAIDATTVDSYGGHSNVTNNSRYTAQVAGWYDLSGTACFNSGTGFRSSMFAVNGTRYMGSCNDTAASPDIPNVPPPSTPVFLNVGDYAEMVVFSSAATSLIVSLTDLRTRFNVVWRSK